LGIEVSRSITELKEIPFDAPPEIWRQAIRQLWNDLNDKDKERIYQQLRSKAQVSEEQDIQYAEKLSDLFEGFDFMPLSPDEWKDQKSAILEKAASQKTLLLFDQDLSMADRTDTEGIGLIQEVLNTEKAIMCGLLSKTFGGDETYRKWEEIVADYHMEDTRHRFVLLSKRDLEEDPANFALMLKLTVLSADCKGLKDRVIQIIKEAVDEARHSLEKIDIYAFEDIVFRSSFNEGVWEPDTLFRLFGVYHREETLKRAKANEELRKQATLIREISHLPITPKKPFKSGTWRIQRREIYDDPGYLNIGHMPIELGDVFERTTNSGNRIFVLLAQPCDLMVRWARNPGERHPSVIEGLLAEVLESLPPKVKGTPAQFEAYYELPYFSQDTGKSYHVSLRKVHTIPLCVLDLCVYHENGEATLRLNEHCTDEVIPPWQRRYELLCVKVKASIDEYSKLQSNTNLSDDYRLKLALCHFGGDETGGKIDLEQQSITYPYKRVLRLRQPRAGVLLTRFSNYISRAAFEHDFGRPEEL
jgi:hypothetical protein